MNRFCKKIASSQVPFAKEWTGFAKRTASSQAPFAKHWFSRGATWKIPQPRPKQALTLPVHNSFCQAQYGFSRENYVRIFLRSTLVLRGAYIIVTVIIVVILVVTVVVINAHTLKNDQKSLFTCLLDRDDIKPSAQHSNLHSADMAE